ncbi:MAG: flagellar biosynthesis protein FlhF [Planctomycetota bacterium]|nr:flagellar biosynthesis protein FlhF [Planctomycetota bacterium]
MTTESNGEFETRTYQAWSMPEALAAAREELGEDVIVLEAHQFRRGGFFGLGRRTGWELTAARRAVEEAPAPELDPSDQTTRDVAEALSPLKDAAEAIRQGLGRLDSASEASNLSQDLGPEPQPELEPVRRAAPSLEASPSEPSTTSEHTEPVTPSASVDQEVPARPRRYRLGPDGEVVESSSASVVEIKPETSTPESSAVIASVEPGEASAAPAGLDQAALQEAVRQSVGAAVEGLAVEMSRIRLLAEQASTSAAAPSSAPVAQPANAAPVVPAVPAAFEDALARLAEQDVPEPLRREILDLAIVRAGGEDPAEEDAREAILQVLRSMLPCVVEGAEPTPGTKRRMALVGPTGVGKTTTLAKLAASLRLERGCTVGLLAADTYRIGAVEQLRSYARMLDIPLRVIRTPGDVGPALEAFDDCDVVLIDTPGRSQRDKQNISELQELLAAFAPDETHLALSAAAAPKVLREGLAAFGGIGADTLLFTKLDEAASLGPLLAIGRDAGRPIGWVTTGQGVPDDLGPARDAGLPEKLLGS